MQVQNEYHLYINWATSLYSLSLIGNKCKVFYCSALAKTFLYSLYSFLNYIHSGHSPVQWDTDSFYFRSLRGLVLKPFLKFTRSGFAQNSAVKILLKMIYWTRHYYTRQFLNFAKWVHSTIICVTLISISMNFCLRTYDNWQHRTNTVAGPMKRLNNIISG